MSEATRSEAQQAGVLVWGQVFGRLAKALAPLLVVRLLGQAEVGVFGSLMLTYTTVSTLLTAGVPRTVLYFSVGRTPGERRTLTLRTVRLMALLGLATAVTLVALGLAGATVAQSISLWVSGWMGKAVPMVDPGDAEMYRLLPLIGLYALFDVPVQVLPQILLSEGRVRASAGFAVASSLGLVLSTLVPVSLGCGVPGVFVALVGFGAFNAGVMALLLRNLYQKYLPVPVEVTLSQMFKYSLPLGATDVVNTLNGAVDLWLIIFAYAPTQLALYQQGAWQIPVLTTIAYSLSAVYVPRYTQMFRAGERRAVIELWRQSAVKVALIVVPATAVFFVGARELMTVAFTHQYADAAPIFQAYCFLTAGRVTAFGNVLVAAGHSRDVLKASLGTLVFNVLLCVPALYVWGFLGPALGTSASYVPAIAIYCWYIAKAYNVRFSETFPTFGVLRVFFWTTPPALLAWWVNQQAGLTPGLSLLLIAAVLLSSYALLGTAVGMIRREDWKLLNDWARMRVLRRA